MVFRCDWSLLLRFVTNRLFNVWDQNVPRVKPRLRMLEMVENGEEEFGSMPHGVTGEESIGSIPYQV